MVQAPCSEGQLLEIDLAMWPNVFCNFINLCASADMVARSCAIGAGTVYARTAACDGVRWSNVAGLANTANGSLASRGASWCAWTRKLYT